MTPFAYLEKSASSLSHDEVRRRRKKVKLAGGGLAGGLVGAMMGASSAAPTNLSELRHNDKSPLVRALVGALVGGAGGVGLAAAGNAFTDYVDIDPLLPTIANESRERRSADQEKTAARGDQIVKALRGLHSKATTGDAQSNKYLLQRLATLTHGPAGNSMKEYTDGAQYWMNSAIKNRAKLLPDTAALISGRSVTPGARNMNDFMKNVTDQSGDSPEHYKRLQSIFKNVKM